MAARSISAALSLALQLSSAALIFIVVAEADYTTASVASVAETAPEAVNRSSFPAGFIFGTASAAYQVVQENFKPTFNVGGNIYKRTMGPLCNVVQEISKPTSNVGGNVYRRTMGPLCNYEGAAKEGGKGPSIWDTFIHNNPGVIIDGSNGDVAIDFYHRYKEDIGFLKYMGMDAFRFSFSWPRILPKGSLSGGVNKEGILFYNNLINDLLANGIQPFVTLFHWDFPQALESKYKGFLSPHVVDDYRDYAEICFREFGDRVKHWITFNQPWSYCKNGYSTGTNAPGRCSSFENANCTAGDSSREPYICGHHLLLAHAAAVKTYRDKYQKNQKGKIGITLVTHWFVPYSNSKADFDAVSRSLDFMFGWFMDPLTQGDYPFSMRAIVRDRLPTFTSKQSQLVKDSFDFLGLNYYTTHYANSFSLLRRVNVSYDSDTHILESGVRRGVPIGPQAASAWLFVYPQGFRELLLYVKNKYNNPLIYITENGVDEANNASWPLEKALRDDRRIDYYRKHLYFLNKAIREGVNVRGYFAWSLLDNFEWRNGYTVRFGIIYVDYKNRLKRYPKISAHWFKKFLK